MSKLPSIFLIGPAGAGKSTVGQELAKELKMHFYDTDTTIEKRTGVNISWIYDVEGEDGFRKREHSILTELVEKTDIILATGGDIVLLAENRALLAAKGLVVYLKTTVDEQLERTRRKDHRPLLQVDDVESRLNEMKIERTPLYEEIADVTFQTDSKSVKAVSKQIFKYLRYKGY